MNFIKHIVIILFLGISLHACAVPVIIKLRDKTVQYESADLKALKSSLIEEALFDRPAWNGTAWEKVKERKIELPLIDSRAFAFIMQLAKKDDISGFAFIDSLDEQSFELMCLYAKATKSVRLIEGLLFKVLKNPQLQKVAKASDDQISHFINGRTWVRQFPDDEHNWQTISLEEKYLQKNATQVHYDYKKIYSLSALLVLIHFYQTTLKQPLPLNTDHLRGLFNAQTQETQQILLNKNLVTLV